MPLTNRTISRRIAKNEMQIKLLKKTVKPRRSREPIKLGNTELILRKCLAFPSCAEWKNKTVLSDSTWRYIEIFLKGKKADEALFYWNQAHDFFDASQKLSLVSAPLTAYYSILNSTKALLKYKNMLSGEYHGVSGASVPGHVHLQNEMVELKTDGVLPKLCSYLGESPVVPTETYSMKDLLYNLEYIHRAFTLTYSNMADLFIPIDYTRFVLDKQIKKAWLEIILQDEHSDKTTINKIKGFVVDSYYNNEDFVTMSRTDKFDWDAPRNIPTPQSLSNFENYYKNIRKQLRYIYPNYWYLKRQDITSSIIDRGTLPITYAAMHRLSEMSRYEPHCLNNHLETKASWLLSEFITKAPYQYIDQISSEITGVDFKPTGFR